MVDRAKIESAKAELGRKAFEIMAAEIPLECVDFRNDTCKSPFKDEETPSAHWYKDGNCLKCFATGLKMDFIDFCMKYHHKGFNDAVKELLDITLTPYDVSEFLSNDEYDFSKMRKADDEPESDGKLVKGYLSKRGISEETIEDCDVKQSPDGHIAYQFFSRSGELIQTKYRVSHSAKKDELKWFWQKGKDVFPLLYGVNRLNYDTPLLIVEGLNDRLACVEAGYHNTVSIPGGALDTHWIDFNFEVLEKCKEIILWFDDDGPGESATKQCADRLGQYRTKIVQKNPQIKKQIGEYYAKYGSTIDKVDANNVLVACGKQAVIDIIAGAKLTENPMVQRLMDVDEIQIQDLPRISSGFTAMDELFFGTFENSLTILTGRSGNGKSCILNTMFVAAPLEENQKVFVYSGEIPAGILLGNIIKPLASNRHILEYINPGKPNGYAVSRDAAKAIKGFYRDSLFVYNDSNEFDTNSKSILKAMEYSFRRYNVKNFVVDSLLTVDCSQEQGEDRYEKQKNFVINLKKFTNAYPVRVALVAHSRKLPAGMSQIGQDDIAGSSDILKCCNRAFSVEILYDDPEGYNTKVTCIKDRETGMLNRFVKLYFDKKSYRIFSNEEEHQKPYEWEAKCHITYPENIAKRLVCNLERERQETDEVFGVIG